MPTERTSENPDAEAAAYWRSVAALSEATEREAAAAREGARDKSAVDIAARHEGETSRTAVSREDAAGRRVRQRL